MDDKIIRMRFFLMNGISAFTKEDPESAYFLSSREEDAALWKWRWAPVRKRIYCPLDLRTLRNKSVVSEPPSPWYCVMPDQTNQESPALILVTTLSCQSLWSNWRELFMAVDFTFWALKHVLLNLLRSSLSFLLSTETLWPDHQQHFCY